MLRSMSAKLSNFKVEKASVDQLQPQQYSEDVDPVVSGAWDWGGGSIKLVGKVTIVFTVGG